VKVEVVHLASRVCVWVCEGLRSDQRLTPREIIYVTRNQWLLSSALPL
jgi:hypothetical protein